MDKLKKTGLVAYTKQHRMYEFGIAGWKAEVGNEVAASQAASSSGVHPSRAGAGGRRTARHPGRC